MTRKKFERLTVALLFILVLIVFSFAQRDSRKLERLYQTGYSLQQESSLPTVQLPPAPDTKATN